MNIPHGPADNLAVSDEFRNWLDGRFPKIDWSCRHHEPIHQRLRELVGRKNGRLMIFMPPRHGKSELVTIRFTAWMLERDPALRVIVAGHSQRLANRFSRRIKSIYDESRRAKALAEGSNNRAKAADEWETGAGGGVKAVGVGTGIAGFGADLVIIDDPMRNRVQAESAHMRQRVYEWFCDDIHTRLEPGAAMILIQTRWHEDDLAGRLIAEREHGEDWAVVNLPALAEPGDELGRSEGEPLWPERFGSSVLAAKKRQLGSYSFAALYQQRPVPREGSVFKREYFIGKVIDTPPAGLRWYRGYDLAVSTRTSADYTASFRVGVDAESNLYIADGFRGRIDFPTQRRYIIDRIESERHTLHGIESALHGAAFVQELLKDRRLAASAITSVRVSQDKFTRSLAWSAKAECGKVFLVRGPWIDDFLDEAYSFPGGRHDDQIDAVSLAVQMIGMKKERRAAGI
jgi:predicted phage terminase large subunit-like protein